MMLEINIQHEKYKREAAEKGYEFLEEVGSRKARYIRVSCGHELIKRMCDMRHHKQARCPICVDSEQTSQIEARGLELVERLSGTSHNRYKFKDCGHELVVRPNDVIINQGKLRCNICYEKQEKEFLETMGIEMLSFKSEKITGFLKPQDYGLYRFKDCGHEFSYLRRSIKHGRQYCITCANIKTIKAITDNGYYLVGELTPRKIVIGFDSCEHTREVYRQAAERGACVCQECKISAYVRPSKIYALELGNDKFSFIKFGYGKNVKTRIGEYGLQDIWLKKILFEIDVPTGNTALSIEKSVHREMKDFRLDKKEMKKYFKHSGFSECYPLSLGDKLLLAVNKYERETND